MFHSTNVFYLDIFASLLTNKIYNMKKLMSIFGVILFAFALTSCCGGSACGDECAAECCAEAPCADDCAKECCAGATPEATPEPTPEPTPEATPEATPTDDWDD